MSPDRSRLVCLEDGAVMHFEVSLTIGRHLLNDLVLDLPEVSTRHAHVEWREGGCAIRDLGSSNGTSVNERHIQGWRILSVGDVIRIARCSTWRVEALVPPSTTPAPSYQETRDLKAAPDSGLVLVLLPDGPDDGVIRLLCHEAGADRKLGETRAGQGYFLLDRLARTPGEWVLDDDLRCALWGRQAPRMARSSLHTLIGNTRKLLECWGATGELIAKETREDPVEPTRGACATCAH